MYIYIGAAPIKTLRDGVVLGADGQAAWEAGLTARGDDAGKH
jgi:hypothetical protein